MLEPGMATINLRESPFTELLHSFFGDVGDAGFAEKNLVPFGGKPDAEAMAIIIAYTPMQPFAVFQHDRNRRV